VLHHLPDPDLGLRSLCWRRTGRCMSWSMRPTVAPEST
jgi:hypothetical protein